MKFYIELESWQFVCQADTASQAILMLWLVLINDSNRLVDQSDIAINYVMHTGRFDEAVIVDSVASYWLLPNEHRKPIREWVTEQTPDFAAQILTSRPAGK